MDSNSQNEKPSESSGGIFICNKCGLTEHFNFKGRKTPYSKTVVLAEEGYVMEDPFSTARNEFLLLGSNCTVCDKPICQSLNCSIFYKQRFCWTCAGNRLDRFPCALQTKFKKLGEFK